MPNYRNQQRAAIPATKRPGPVPNLDGLTIRPRRGKPHFDSEYFAPPPQAKDKEEQTNE